MNSIKNWFVALARVWRREFRLVFTDPGVLVFFFVLPLLYPVVYTLIYNPELARDVPVAVVDNSRSSLSRELVRMADATEQMKVIGYAADLQEARRWQNEKACYGIMVIPEDYARRMGKGEQAVVPFYTDMSLLLRYRGFLTALTDLQLATGAKFREEKVNSQLGILGQNMGGQPVNSSAHFMGDPEQGFCSFVIPGIVVLILQQSLVLGICMLGGGSAERRRRNGGVDPMRVDAPAGATALGKALCYLVIYIPLSIYVLHYVPWMFSLPQAQSFVDVMLFTLPLLLASIFFGMTIQVFVTERESSMLVVVFTSVAFLFLSGLTWPRYAMNGFWQMVGACIPATWGVEGFIRINSNDGTLAQNAHPYMMMWVLAGVYFMISYCYWRWGAPCGRRLSAHFKKA